MKLVSLNTWGGRVFDPLMDFFKKYSNKIDIFCLQEIYDCADTKDDLEIRANLFNEIQNVLPNHDSFLYPSLINFVDNEEISKYDNVSVKFGLSIFTKKNIQIIENGDIFVFKDRKDIEEYIKDGRELPRNLSYIKFKHDNKEYFVYNLHGIWTGGGKGDTTKRIEQSDKARAFLDTVKCPKILCGDFNLLPNTESLKILEKDMKNLIKEYNVKSTRSHYYTKEHKFADYILVSKDVTVKDFKVLDDVVSDHLPLYLEFE